MVRLPFDQQAKVSVIVPTRDRCGLLQRALDSVRGQTYGNFEIIVVDDASTDGTAAMLERLAEPRLRVLRNPERRGAGYCRHLGADMAVGDFVAFLDSDDYWLPSRLATQLAAVEAAGTERTVVLSRASFVVGDEIFGPDQPALEPGERISEYLYARGATLQTSCFLIAGPFARAVRFDASLRVNQDTDYLLRLERAGARFLYLDRILTCVDTGPRADRISVDPALVDASQAWFRRVSGDWSAQARKGYLRIDLALRYGVSGRRLRALGCWLRGYDRTIAPVGQLRMLVVALCGGRVPPTLRRLRRAFGGSAPVLKVAWRSDPP